MIHSKWKKTVAITIAAVTIMCTTATAYAATGVAKTNVMIREKASTSSTALATVKKGKSVTVISTQGDWAKVKDGSRTGYISTRFLDIDGSVPSSGSSSSSQSSSGALKKGDEGDAVKTMQQKLIDQGFLKTEATGYFGTATQSAVKAFQRSVSISADGVAGSATMKALLAGDASSGSGGTSPSSAAMQKGDESAQVTSLQRMLIELGYLKTEATGYFGSATKTAVSAFQTAQKLTADGVVGKATLAALEKRTGALENPSSSSGGVLLKEGDQSDAVKQMQKLLISAGYLKTDATGFFGSATASAVRAFQKKCGLTADGIAGEATMAKLNQSSSSTSSGGSSSSSSPGSSGDTQYEETRHNGNITLEDWWSGNLSSVMKRSQTFTVTDVRTGLSFKCARYGGDNHLDAEPCTAQDTSAMFSAYNSKWSWSARPIWLSYEGVTYAAAMNGMPHGGQKITTNNFSGQFCIHFLNSRSHGGNQVNKDMQTCIMEAFGD